MVGNVGRKEVLWAKLNTGPVQITFTFIQWINSHVAVSELQNYIGKSIHFLFGKVMLKSNVWTMVDGSIPIEVESGPIIKLAVE